MVAYNAVWVAAPAIDGDEQAPPDGWPVPPAMRGLRGSAPPRRLALDFEREGERAARRLTSASIVCHIDRRPRLP